MPPSTGSLFRASLLKLHPLDNNFHYTMDTEWYLRVGKQVKFHRINKVLSSFRVSNDNKTSEHIKTGKVLPQHAKEQQLYFQKHILPVIETHKLLNLKIFYTIHKTIMPIWIKSLKLKYLHLYILNKFFKKGLNYQNCTFYKRPL
jgi:hypothetical protein